MDNNNSKADKRTTILQATLALIAEQGFHNTPTSQIAEKARVGVGSIYRYFKDKDDLIHALFEYVIEKEGSEILKEYNPKAPLRERYIYICTSMIQFAVQHPKESNFLEQYVHSPYGLSQRREIMLKPNGHRPPKPPLMVIFETGKTQQVIKDLPGSILMALTFGSIFEVIREINAGLMAYDAELAQRLVEACWDAIKR